MNPGGRGTGDGDVPHVHDWAGMAFDVDAGEHPVMMQSCACGATRTVRAWEAFWEPGGAPAAHPAPAQPRALPGGPADPERAGGG